MIEQRRLLDDRRQSLGDALQRGESSLLANFSSNAGDSSIQSTTM